MPVAQGIAPEFISAPYAANGDGKIGVHDFSPFLSQFGKAPRTEAPQAYRFDYDRNGHMGLGDFASFIREGGKIDGSSATRFARIVPQPSEEFILTKEALEFDDSVYDF
ncbi:hypothetical protein [Bremerella sp.]|uniref:hypothetical protein n=1 Tax=Bremerella sp. TaxID=2795602 RepID=UPI00391979B2